jgi:hypothetical protein
MHIRPSVEKTLYQTLYEAANHWQPILQVNDS